MTCDHVPMPRGGTAIVCSTTKRCKCRRRATLACDWKVPGRKSGTCDAPLCDRRSTSPAPGKDLCERHAEAYIEWRTARDA